MKILNLTFISNTEQGLTYDVKYERDVGFFFPKTETYEVRVFIRYYKKIKDYSCTAEYYNSGDNVTFMSPFHLALLILNDYELLLREKVDLLSKTLKDKDKEIEELKLSLNTSNPGYN